MEQTNNTTEQNWLDEEQKELGTEQKFIKMLSMKFEENKVTEFEIDFSKPFEKWTTTDQKGKTIIKAIIPVKHNGEIKNWWCNKKNPVFREIINAGKIGQKTFKIMQTGRNESTKYILVK